MPEPGRAALTVGVCTDATEFGDLGEQWNRLHRRSRSATPFQSHAWLHSWWLSYGSRGRLRVVLVRDGERLVAAAPLMRGPGPLARLVPLGGPLSDFHDVLIDDTSDDTSPDPGPDLAEQAADALVEGFRELARAAVIDFREARPGSAVERVHARWRGPRHRLGDSLCLELPAVPMDELVRRLPTPRAQRARAKMRKLDALGIEPRVVPAPEVGTSVHRLLELHQLQWQGRKVTAEHLTPRFAEHLTRSVSLMVQAGDAVVTEFRLDDAVVAADLTLRSPRLAGGYLYGADPGLRERKADVATLLLRSCADQLCAEPFGGGYTEPGVLSLLRGNEPYKRHWRPHTVVNQRLLFARRRTAPLLGAVLASAGARATAKRALGAWRERGGGPP
ncbi:GNAT family N-acetyltransferase [Streptomyces apocyni]|uniref:GNAT family N-acetyltransferase n=1 Tax=Streptomyces apocyni TaxID=2654677 RepID=UPI0012E998E2|nr:GNAT family N-acetyltransferase [Streptomyces apocyni]